MLISVDNFVKIVGGGDGFNLSRNGRAVWLSIGTRNGRVARAFSWYTVSPV